MGEEIKGTDVVPHPECKEINWKTSGNRIVTFLSAWGGGLEGDKMMMK